VGGSLAMLRSPLDFAALQSAGKSRAHPLLLVRYRRNDLERTRYGISTGRRLGSAVVRNRVRRRLRSVLRQLDVRVVPGWDILIVARPAASTASQAELLAVVERLLRSGALLATTPDQ
jgi:ribonuclease P protein component